MGSLTDGNVLADALIVVDILKVEVTYITCFLSLPTLVAWANRKSAAQLRKAIAY